MMNWIYYQLAMYWLRRASKVRLDHDLWLAYMKISVSWIEKVKL